ncbi:MAG TPA: hypothetical protein VM260_27655, partial [Pirellula sp.]|nr:hypothetical protein [Pirellula sp.]
IESRLARAAQLYSYPIVSEVLLPANEEARQRRKKADGFAISLCCSLAPGQNGFCPGAQS